MLYLCLIKPTIPFLFVFQNKSRCTQFQCLKILRRALNWLQIEYRPWLHLVKYLPNCRECTEPQIFACNVGAFYKEWAICMCFPASTLQAGESGRGVGSGSGGSVGNTEKQTLVVSAQRQVDRNKQEPANVGLDYGLSPLGSLTRLADSGINSNVFLRLWGDLYCTLTTGGCWAFSIIFCCSGTPCISG